LPGRLARSLQNKIAAAKRLQAAQQEAAFAASAAENLVRSAGSSAVAADFLAYEGHKSLEQHRLNDSEQFRSMLQSMEAANERNDFQISQLAATLQQLRIFGEGDRQNWDSGQNNSNQAPTSTAQDDGGGGNPSVHTPGLPKASVRVSSTATPPEIPGRLARPSQAESIKLHSLPSAAGFRAWKQFARGEVVIASGHPEEATQRITFTETISSDDLAGSSISVLSTPNWQHLSVESHPSK
jgi:hypothetical protein